MLFEPPRAHASRKPGGTLSSPAAPAIVEPPVNVALAAPKASFGETLPSKDDRPERTPELEWAGRVGKHRRSLLVAAGFVAGFLLGWAVGRM